MAQCVDCSCKQVNVGVNACNALHDSNDRVAGAYKVLSDARPCDYPKLLPKVIFTIWCVIKNAIAQICWLTSKVGDIISQMQALEKLLQDLKGSGAWIQTGDTIFEGHLAPNRHLATGNINLFGGTPDGPDFIRTNSGSTENDLAGGI